MIKQKINRYVVLATVAGLGVVGLGGYALYQNQNPDIAFAEEAKTDSQDKAKDEGYAAQEKTKTGDASAKSKENDSADGKTKAPKNDFHHYLEDGSTLAKSDPSTVKIQLSELPALFNKVYADKGITDVSILPGASGYEYLVTSVTDKIEYTATINASTGKVTSKFSDDAKVSEETGSTTPPDFAKLTSQKDASQTAEKQVGQGQSKIWRLTTVKGQATWEVGVLGSDNTVTQVNINATNNTVLK